MHEHDLKKIAAQFLSCTPEAREEVIEAELRWFREAVAAALAGREIPKRDV